MGYLALVLCISTFFVLSKALVTPLKLLGHTKVTTRTCLHAANNKVITLDKIPLPSGTATSFGNPKIIPPGKTNMQWLLWHHVRDDKFADDIVKLSTGRVMFATSSDGLSDWKYHADNPALNPSVESGDWFLFDATHVGVGDVIEPGQIAQSKFKTQEGMLVMYTFGGSGESKPSMGDPNRVIKGSRMEIGVAVSQDGAHWSRVEGPCPHGSILTTGKEGEFDHLFVAFPSVIEIGSEYKLFYHTYDANVKKYSVGLAVASDGLLSWKKRGPVLTGGLDKADFDYLGVTRRFVGQMEDGSLQMWYEGVSANQVHSIGLARSTDGGYSWAKLYSEPVFAPSEEADAWDAGGVGSPHLVWLSDRRRWRMYYMGDPKDKTSGAPALGVAESTDESGHKFVRLNL